MSAGLRWMLVGLVLTATGVVLLVTGLDRANLPPPAAVSQYDSLPVFSLQHQDSFFDNAELRGHWTLLFLGYTQCPDVCPTTLGLLKSLRQRWSRAGSMAPQVVLVSVDPDRDSPETLGRYVAAFDPSFQGITGSEAQLRELVRGLGGYYQRHAPRGGGRYSIDHSTDLYLIDPSGRLRARFQQPLEGVELERKIRRFMD